MRMFGGLASVGVRLYHCISASNIGRVENDQTLIFRADDGGIDPSRWWEYASKSGTVPRVNLSRNLNATAGNPSTVVHRTGQLVPYMIIALSRQQDVHNDSYVEAIHVAASLISLRDVDCQITSRAALVSRHPRAIRTRTLVKRDDPAIIQQPSIATRYKRAQVCKGTG